MDTLKEALNIISEWIKRSQQMPLYEGAVKWTEENQGKIHTGKYKTVWSKWKLVNWWRKITKTEKQEEIILHIWRTAANQETMEQTNDDQDKVTDIQNEQYANEQGYDMEIIKMWIEHQKFPVPLSKENWPECYPTEGGISEEIKGWQTQQESEEWVAEQIRQSKLAHPELDKQLFTDMLLSNTATIHVDDVTRIVPGSKEWWDVRDKLSNREFYANLGKDSLKQEPAGADIVMAQADGSKQVSHIPPEQNMYSQQVPNSQWVTTLEQILSQVKMIGRRAELKDYDQGSREIGGVTWVRITSIQEDINQLRVAIENSIAKGMYIVDGKGDNIKGQI